MSRVRNFFKKKDKSSKAKKETKAKKEEAKASEKVAPPAPTDRVDNPIVAKFKHDFAKEVLSRDNDFDKFAEFLKIYAELQLTQSNKENELILRNQRLLVLNSEACRRLIIPVVKAVTNCNNTDTSVPYFKEGLVNRLSGEKNKATYLIALRDLFGQSAVCSTINNLAFVKRPLLDEDLANLLKDISETKQEAKTIDAQLGGLAQNAAIALHIGTGNGKKEIKRIHSDLVRRDTESQIEFDAIDSDESASDTSEVKMTSAQQEAIAKRKSEAIMPAPAIPSLPGFAPILPDKAVRAITRSLAATHLASNPTPPSNLAPILSDKAVREITGQLADARSSADARAALHIPSAPLAAAVPTLPAAPKPAVGAPPPPPPAPTAAVLAKIAGAKKGASAPASGSAPTPSTGAKPPVILKKKDVDPEDLKNATEARRRKMEEAEKAAGTLTEEKEEKKDAYKLDDALNVIALMKTENATSHAQYFVLIFTAHCKLANAKDKSDLLSNEKTQALLKAIFTAGDNCAIFRKGGNLREKLALELTNAGIKDFPAYKELLTPFFSVKEISTIITENSIIVPAKTVLNELVESIKKSNPPRQKSTTPPVPCAAANANGEKIVKAEPLKFVQGEFAALKGALGKMPPRGVQGAPASEEKNDGDDPFATYPLKKATPLAAPFVAPAKPAEEEKEIKEHNKPAAQGEKVSAARSVAPSLLPLSERTEKTVEALTPPAGSAPTTPGMEKVQAKSAHETRVFFIKNQNTQFWFKSLDGRNIGIEVTPEDTLFTLKQKIANKLCQDAGNSTSTFSTTDNIFADGFIIIYAGQRVNDERNKKYTDNTLVAEMTDVFDIRNNNMGMLFPFNEPHLERHKGSPFVYNRGTLVVPEPVPAAPATASPATTATSSPRPAAPGMEEIRDPATAESNRLHEEARVDRVIGGVLGHIKELYASQKASFCFYKYADELNGIQIAKQAYISSVSDYTSVTFTEKKQKFVTPLHELSMEISRDNKVGEKFNDCAAKLNQLIFDIFDETKKDLDTNGKVALLAPFRDSAQAFINSFADDKEKAARLHKIICGIIIGAAIVLGIAALVTFVALSGGTLALPVIGTVSYLGATAVGAGLGAGVGGMIAGIKTAIRCCFFQPPEPPAIINAQLNEIDDAAADVLDVPKTARG